MTGSSRGAEVSRPGLAASVARARAAAAAVMMLDDADAVEGEHATLLRYSFVQRFQLVLMCVLFVTWLYILCNIDNGLNMGRFGC